MARDLKAGLIRFPHVESILDAPIELSDGAILRTDETFLALGLVKSIGYDVWELPLISYIAARENGFEATAIPVFPTRRFVQWMVEVPENSEIHEVKNLEGKRIVQHYNANTDSVWAKGLFEETYDMDLSSVFWFTLRPGHKVPDGVVCLDGTSRDELLLNGVVDAAITSGHGNPPRPGVRRMFVDPEREAAEWYKSARVFPMLHVVVVRDSALVAHKSLAHDLYQLFEKAKNDALVKWDYGASLPKEKQPAALWSGFPGSAWNGTDRNFLGRDPIPYGLELEANHNALQQLIRYGVRQQALERTHSVGELFAPV